MSKTITRREFLKKSVSGAGLAIAVLATPSGYRLLSAEEVKDISGAFSPAVWLRITPDNIVTVLVSKSEMGEGVHTSLPMIVADELDADWKLVRVQMSSAEGKYNDPVSGMQLTGGSTSIRHMYEPLRKAGAAAREMLVKAAAQAWGVPAGECSAHEGWVKHALSGKKMSFGDLSVPAAKLPVPQKPVLKKENMFNLIGKPIDRLDIHDKVKGSAKFGIDTFLTGMLYAAIDRPPAFGAEPASYEREAAMKIKGVKEVVKIARGIAVCAETPDDAWKGRDALKVRWSKGVEPELDNNTLDKKFKSDLAKKGLVARKEGDAESAFAKATRKHSVTYVLPYLYHATMEPMNCTADVRKDGCDIWVPTQFQTAVLGIAAKETGLKPEQINIHTTYLGGGFGRRAETDVAEEAVMISKAVGKPVKLIWKREEDVKFDFFRPGNASKVEGALDEKGRLISWSHKIACPSIFARVFPSRLKDGIDPAAVDCLSDLEYEVPNLTVEYVRTDTPVPVGFWRSVGASHNAFTVESFVDEMAHLAKKDPLEFRLDLLKNHKRSHRVLEVVAEKAGWSKPLTKGHGRGIAWAFAFGSYVAEVAEVSVDKKSGAIKVHRVVCAVDCGPYVNPTIIKAQMTGGITMGLSAALKERVNFAGGGVSSSNFDDYQLLNMSEAPEVEVHIVESTDEQGGIGEPGLPPIAPAVANAVFNAIGLRLRQLPMNQEAVMKEIKAV